MEGDNDSIIQETTKVLHRYRENHPWLGTIIDPSTNSNLLFEIKVILVEMEVITFKYLPDELKRQILIRMQMSTDQVITCNFFELWQI